MELCCTKKGKNQKNTIYFCPPFYFSKQCAAMILTFTRYSFKKKEKYISKLFRYFSWHFLLNEDWLKIVRSIILNSDWLNCYPIRFDHYRSFNNFELISVQFITFKTYNQQQLSLIKPFFLHLIISFMITKGSYDMKY